MVNLRSILEQLKNYSEVQTLGLHFNNKFEVLVKENGFKNLTDFMSVSVEDSLRSVPERITVGLTLKNGTDEMRVYLKRHWTEIKSNSRQPHREAVAEWENINRLQEAKLPVPEALACGYGFIDGHSVGFVMILEVPGIQGDHFLRDHWRFLSSSGKRDLLNEWANLAKLFHDLGYNHRDFYLCHTFVSYVAGKFILHLIDLQRVQKHRFFRRRWIIKDLAQLAYSSLGLVSRTYRLRFYLIYLAKKTSGKDEKRLAKKVQQKINLMLNREKAGKVR